MSTPRAKSKVHRQSKQNLSTSAGIHASHAYVYMKRINSLITKFFSRTIYICIISVCSEARWMLEGSLVLYVARAQRVTPDKEDELHSCALWHPAPGPRATRDATWRRGSVWGGALGDCQRRAPRATASVRILCRGRRTSSSVCAPCTWNNVA